MDDLIVPSTDYEGGIERLKIVLETASQHGFIINWSKCYILQSCVEYLRHQETVPSALQNVKQRPYCDSQNRVM